MTLLRLLFENVIQTIQQDRSELHVVPNSERSQDPRICHCCEGAKRNKTTDTQIAVNDLQGTDPKENRSRQETNRLQDAVPRHYDERGLEKFLRYRKKLIEHGVTKRALGRRRFYSLDPLDRIDLMRIVFALALFHTVIKGAQHLYRKNH